MIEKTIEELREELELLDKKTAIHLYCIGKTSEAVELAYFRNYE